METLYLAAILNYIYQNGQTHLPRLLCYNNKVKKQAQVVKVEMFYFRVPPVSSSLLSVAESRGRSRGGGGGGPAAPSPSFRRSRSDALPETPCLPAAPAGERRAAGVQLGSDTRRRQSGAPASSRVPAASLVFCGKRHSPPQQ